MSCHFLKPLYIVSFYINFICYLPSDQNKMHNVDIIQIFKELFSQDPIQNVVTEKVKALNNLKYTVLLDEKQNISIIIVRGNQLQVRTCD